MEVMGQEGSRGPFSYSYPPMDPKVPTKLALDLTMDNTADVCVWAFTNRVMKSPKRCDYASSVEAEFGLKRVLCHAILNEGERLFKSTAETYI